MRLKFSHIYLSGLLLTASMTGCVMENESTPCPDDATDAQMTVTFTLEVQQSEGGRGSRAADEGTTWGSDYESDNVNYDDAIDYTTVQVAIMDNDGRYITTVDNLKYFEISSSASYTAYQYYGTISPKLFSDVAVGTKYRCMVVANCGTVDFENLDEQLTYNIQDVIDAITNGNYHMPMWGVSTFSFTKGSDTQNAGDIWMLKAVAKSRVSLSDALVAKGYKIGNIAVKNSKSEGNVFPGSYSAVGNTKELSYVSTAEPYCFNELDVDYTTEIAMTDEPAVDDSNGSEKIVYFPEMTNSKGSDAPYIAIDVEDPEGRTTSYTIVFKNFDTDKYYANLVRNHVYDFEVIGFKHGAELDIKVTDWEESEEEWDFTDQISGDLTIKWTSGFEYVNTLTKTVTLLSSTESHQISLEGEFTIYTPVGATWFATLTTSDYFSFEFVDSDNVTHLDSSVTGEIDGKTKSTFRVRATNINNSMQHTCEITFYVRYKNGTSRKVDELSGWTIIQTN